MAAPSGQLLLPRMDTGGLPEAPTLHHGRASWDLAGTYTFIVPAGVTRLLIDLQGAWALGGNDGANPVIPMGPGRCVHWVDVSPGTSLTIVVGAAGTGSLSGDNSTCTGPGFSLTAGGGNPLTIGIAAIPAPASLRTSSGGNVVTQGNGVGYCIITW